MITIHEKAIEDAIKLTSWVQNFVKALEGKKGENAKEYGSSFRSRARGFPELMESSGFLSACTFFYAKATEMAYKKICQLLDDEKIEPINVNKEEFGYATFLHGILAFLEVLGLVSSHKSPRKAINELKEPVRLTITRSLLLSYMIEVKKLSEALFEGVSE
jgi:CRISPR type III-B/RAMP module-associated protein Cmr5